MQAVKFRANALFWARFDWQSGYKEGFLLTTPPTRSEARDDALHSTSRTRPVIGDFIAGRWREPRQSEPLAVLDPSDGSAIADVHCGTAEDAIAAADAAADALDDWANRAPRDRADRLLALSRALESRAQPIGELVSREVGKLRSEGEAEVRFAAEYFRWFAEEIRRPNGELIPADRADRRQIVVTRPVGVAACLTPWNFPVSIQARKLAPALAAGCTTVSRTSEQAPLAVIEMFRCMEEAGFPNGVANLVNGPADEQSRALLGHSAVRVVSFTGSTEVGRYLMRLAADRIVRPILELGGNAPFLVFEDADLDSAVEGAIFAKFRNNGQSCVAANHFYVQDAVYDEFAERFASAVNDLVVGSPSSEPAPNLGPVANESRVRALRDLVERAEQAGARRLTRRTDLPAEGSFVGPELFDELGERSPLEAEEVFGPIAGLARFRTTEEVVARANCSELGLAAYLYTNDFATAWQVAERLEVGMLACNNPLPSTATAPMGGVKQSGLGREGSHLGLEDFQEPRYLNLAI